MKSKPSVGQHLQPVVRILNGALTIIFAMFVLSGSLLAQVRLPFIGTRTFCGEIEGTMATVSIRKDGFTTIKTNMVTGLGSEPATARYETFSGMLNAKGILRRGNFYLTIKSGTDINVYAYPNQDNINGKLCASSPVLTEKKQDVQRTPAAPPSARSNQVPDTVSVQVALQGLTEISFKRLKSRDIAKLYPALKDLVLTKRDVSDVADLQAFPPTALIADVRDVFTNLNLLFLTDFWCSKQTGCAFQIYADEGSGYGLVHGGSVKGPFFLLKDKEETSVVYCAYNEIDEWSYERNAWRNERGDIMRGHNFKFKGRYTGKGVPACK